MAIGNPEGSFLLTIAWGQLQTDCLKLPHHYSIRRQCRLWSRMRSESHFVTPGIGLCLQIRTGLLVSNSLDTLRDMTSEPPCLQSRILAKFCSGTLFTKAAHACHMCLVLAQRQ